MKLTVDRFEVGNRAGPSPIEQIATDAAVARSTTLASACMGERVLDGDALAQLLSAGRRLDELLEALLKRLVLGDGDGAAMPRRSIRAFRSTWAAVTRLGIELDRGSKLDALGVTLGTRDRAIADVDLEERFREMLTVTRGPWTADNLAIVVGDFLDEGSIDVASVDIEPRDSSLEVIEVVFEIDGRFLLGPIGGSQRAGEHEAGIEVEGEGFLDAASEQQRNTRLAADSLLTPGKQRRGAGDDLSAGVSEQVDRVLDAPGAFEGHRIHRDSKALGQLAEVECAGGAGELDRPFEKPLIHISANHSLAKLLKRTLRERRIAVTQPVEHHLPAEVDDRPLDRLGVGDAVISLQQHRHRHQPRTNRLLTGARLTVHLRQLVEECVIEQLMSMLAGKPKQLPVPGHSRQQRLLLSRRRL